eukprot:NODE_4459_length_1889_cov_2.558456.p1 GENE.NODE_4459_length_1889_cov_2.558456~~NODE_4459_length_1889_cov_2.558456.p1  ORF type:complete len:561 (-),score=167.23 NODE_4459_length_1889_cov_2.558456:206-1675(-)
MLRSLEFQVGALFELMEAHAPHDVNDGAVTEVISRKRESVRETFDAVKEAMWWQQQNPQQRCKHCAAAAAAAATAAAAGTPDGGEELARRASAQEQDASRSWLRESTASAAPQEQNGSVRELRALQSELARRVAAVMEDDATHGSNTPCAFRAGASEVSTGWPPLCSCCGGAVAQRGSAASGDMRGSGRPPGIGTSGGGAGVGGDMHAGVRATGWPGAAGAAAATQALPPGAVRGGADDARPIRRGSAASTSGAALAPLPGYVTPLLMSPAQYGEATLLQRGAPMAGGHAGPPLPTHAAVPPLPFTPSTYYAETPVPTPQRAIGGGIVAPLLPYGMPLLPLPGQLPLEHCDTAASAYPPYPMPLPPGPVASPYPWPWAQWPWAGASDADTAPISWLEEAGLSVNSLMSPWPLEPTESGDATARVHAAAAAATAAAVAASAGGTAAGADGADSAREDERELPGMPGWAAASVSQTPLFLTPTVFHFRSSG